MRLLCAQMYSGTVMPLYPLENPTLQHRLAQFMCLKHHAMTQQNTIFDGVQSPTRDMD